MARQCDITGVKAATGNNVSHSMRHTKRRFLPNLQEKRFYSNLMGQFISLRVTNRALRTISKYGDIDTFMTQWKKRKTETFSQSAMKARKQILSKADASAVA